MDIIQDQITASWLFSPLGVILFVVLTGLVLSEVAARIVDAVEDTVWRLGLTRQQRAEPTQDAGDGLPAGRMGQ